MMDDNYTAVPVPIFDFERNFNEVDFQQYMARHWTNSLIYSAVYIAFVFGGQRFMQNRPGYDLRWALIVWSGLLAMFSIIGTARTLPEMISAIRYRSLKYSMCDSTYYKGVSGFWGSLFVVSKAYELGDTFFIVMRKQPVVFLHWYHHATVLVYTWYSYPEANATGRWFMNMNYVVHSFMYTYYLIRAMRFKIPRAASMCVTILQILQMVVGLVIPLWAYRIKSSGEPCKQSIENLRLCSLMYLSYLVLFSHFFYTRYFLKPSDSSKKIS